MNSKLCKQAGFTLAELLIVVGIIGVLAAVSIPIVGPRLEGSRESADVTNLRSAYAAAISAVLVGKADDITLSDDDNGEHVLVYTRDGTLKHYSTAAYESAIRGKSTQNDWQGTDMSDELPSAIVFSGNSGKKGICVKVNMLSNRVQVRFTDQPDKDFDDLSDPSDPSDED